MALVSSPAALATAPQPHSEELNAHTSQMSSAPHSSVVVKPIQSGEYHCTGYYGQATSKYAMAFVAKFDAVDGDNDDGSDSAISAMGSDAFGQFTIEGRCSQRHVVFKKHYSRYSVDYEGEIIADPEDKGAKLTGKWTISEFDTGEFSFILDRVDANEQLVESATWRGHYHQWWGSHDTSFLLKVYTSGRFEGSGNDAAGPFTLYGLFVDGSTSGPFHFTKQYTTHAISYRGERNGDVLTGEYESKQCRQDTFSMKRVDDDE